MKKKFTSLLIISIAIILVSISVMLPIIAEELTTDDGFKYTVMSGGTAEITGYTGTGGDITIPDKIGDAEVTSIGTSAFENNTTITGVVIGDNMLSIGKWAFKGCANIATIDLGEGVQVIGEGAIENITALEAVVIPESVIEIGLWSFAGDTNLKSVVIGSNVRTIKYNAFEGCTSLKEITIPPSVESIEKEVFKKCTALEKINVLGHPSVGDSAFGSVTPTYHPICGAVCTHGEDGAPDASHSVSAWTEWTEYNSMPTESGHYVLMNNVTLSEQWGIGHDKQIVLCLNGYTLQSTEGRVISINSEREIYNVTAELTVCDCQGVQGRITGGDATDTNSPDDWGNGAGVCLYNDATFNLYGGRITGNYAYRQGGGVYAGNTGTFNMWGGEISDNSVMNQGAGVAISNGSTFNMYGGVIKNNSAGMSGGGVYCDYGAAGFNLYNGLIEGNSSEKGGGGVHLTNIAPMNMYGGIIRNNTAGTEGGGIGMDRGNLIITGGEITGNTATEAGGGIYSSYTVSITDCVISGNKSLNSNGGGVFVKAIRPYAEEPTVTTLSGLVKIIDNTGKDGSNDLHLQKDAPLTIGAMSEGSSITVSSDDDYGESTLVGGAAYIGYFKALSDDYHLIVSGENIEYKAHTFIYDRCDAENHTYVCVCTKEKTDPHIYNSIVDEKYLKSEASGNTPATYRMSCDCGYIHQGEDEVFYIYYHPECGAECTHETKHEDIQFITWHDTAHMPMSSGNYMLMCDVTISDTWKGYDGDMVICLNGHTIKTLMGRVIEVAEGRTLTICDCSGGHGTITGGELDSTGAGVQNLGTFNMYAGIITKNESNTSYGGGGGVHTRGTFNMWGGEIYDNFAQVAGGVYITGTAAVFNMYGGKISANNAVSYQGGGIRTNGGVFNMYGGEISDNYSYNGGGVFLEKTTMTMYGGKIINNRSTGAGGGVGGWISFTMLGGEISGNRASRSIADGVYVPNGCQLVISGKVNISGNGEEVGGGNVCLVEGAKLSVGALDPESKIGIMLSPGFSGMISDTGAAYIASFWSENEAYSVIADGEGIAAHLHTFVLDKTDETYHYHVCSECQFGIKHEHTYDDVIGDKFLKENGQDGKPDVYFLSCTNCEYLSDNTFETYSHPICGAVCTHDGAHPDVQFILWRDASSLPSGSGIYKLMTDVSIIESWAPPADTVLCLNGHDIIYVGSEKDSVIMTGSITFTLCDCQKIQGRITGGNRYDGGGIYLNGTLNMYGGRITGNTSSSGGAGIYSQGTINMYGGEISGNSSGDTGGGVYNNGTFTMYGGRIVDNVSKEAGGGVFNVDDFIMNGGEISGNSSTNSTGGGLFGQSYTSITVSGDARIIGNSGKDGENNIHLQPSAKVQVGELSDGALFGIATDDGYNDSFCTAGADSIGYFKSDKAGFEIVHDGEKVIFSEHTEHTWEQTLTSSADHHYYACTKCPAKSGEEAHEYLLENATDKYYAERDCTSEIYRKSCKCGHSSADAATFKVTVETKHSFGSDYENDENHHWHKCSACGELDIKVEHTFNDDTVCDICGYNSYIPDENESGSESETEPETESETEPETESETKPETRAESESETKPETESETGPETESETEPETDPETEPDTVTEKEAQSEDKQEESKTETETKPTSNSSSDGCFSVANGGMVVITLILTCGGIILLRKKRRV